MVDFMVFNWA